MMKCVVIHGSPRKGNTWDVLNRVKGEMLKKGDFTFDDVILKDVKLNQCVGCFNCIFKGEDKCPHKESMEWIIEKIEKADVIIITSPVYSMNVTGTLKTFIDHMSFKFHRPSYFYKKGLVITTTAGAGHDTVGKYIKSVLKYWGVNDVQTIGVAYRANDLSEKNIKYIENKSGEIALKFLKNRVEKPSIKSVCMYNAWKGMASNGKKEDADYKYWRDEDLQKGEYHKGIKIGIFKKVLGKISYKVMKKVT